MKNRTAAPLLTLFSGFFILVITVFSACVGSKTDSETKEQYLPTIIKNIELGMSQNMVLNLRKKAYIVNSVQETPREIYTEDLETENYTSVYYLFDKTGNKNLAEINILHKSKEAAGQTIKAYFGTQKNDKQNQWHKILKNGTTIHATWRKQKVFIYLEEKEIKSENIREQ
jgi:flagellar hook protein FlgE